MTVARVYLVCALPCEAKPIIDTYKLKKNVSISAFSCFQSKDGLIHLLISGIGKLSAAISTSFIAAMNSNTPASFINLGIAGCQNQPIGSVWLAHKIQDAASQINVYPKSYLIKKVNTISLLTYDKPCSYPPLNTLADMEAFGFFQAATKYTTQECIHVLKIVSDNHPTDQNHLNKKRVNELITINLPTIQNVIYQCQNILHQAFPAKPKINPDLLTRVHFSAQQKRILSEYVRRAHALKIDLKLDNDPNFAKETITAKEILTQLKTQLANCY